MAGGGRAMNAMRADCVAAHARDAAAEVLASDGDRDGAAIGLTVVDRVTIEVTVLKAVHPALFAAILDVDRRHRAERMRLLCTGGLRVEQQPDAAVAASANQSSLAAHASSAVLGSQAPHMGDGGRPPPSAVVVDDEMGSVFR